MHVPNLVGDNWITITDYQWLEQLSGSVKAVTKMVTGCLRTTKFAIIALGDLKVFYWAIKNVGLCLYIIVKSSLWKKSLSKTIIKLINFICILQEIY